MMEFRDICMQWKKHMHLISALVPIARCLNALPFADIDLRFSDSLHCRNCRGIEKQGTDL